MALIVINSDAWYSLTDEIITTFAPGVLIPHEWLHEKFGVDDFRKARLEDFENIQILVRAVKRAELDYMFMIETLRRQLLERFYGYMINIHGDGYMILPYDEQVTYAFRKFLEVLEKSIKKTDLIMKYIPPVSAEQQRRDNDTKARYSWFKQAVKKVEE